MLNNHTSQAGNKAKKEKEKKKKKEKLCACVWGETKKSKPGLETQKKF